MCVFILNDRLFVGKAAQISCIAPTGHIHPQNQRLVNKSTINNTPIKKKGKLASAIEKNIYSRKPAPLESGLRGEFKIGRALKIFSKLSRFIEKMNSMIT